MSQGTAAVQKYIRCYPLRVSSFKKLTAHPFYWQFLTVKRTPCPWGYDCNKKQYALLLTFGPNLKQTSAVFFLEQNHRKTWESLYFCATHSLHIGQECCWAIYPSSKNQAISWAYCCKWTAFPANFLIRTNIYLVHMYGAVTADSTE